MSSTSFGSSKRPSGKAFRDGTLGKALDKLYAEVEAACVSLEAGGGGGVPTTRTIATTAPLTGGGDLSTGRTIAMPVATDSVDGYMPSVAHTALTGAVASIAGGPSLTVLGVKRTAVIPVLYTDIVAAAATAIGPTLPANAVITRAFYIVTQTFTSGGADAATIAIGLDGAHGSGNANSLVTATAISAGGNVWDAGPHEAIPDGTIAAAVLTGTVAQKVLFTEAGAQALTAGALTLVLEYIVYA